jgi:hypothetical protein
MEEISEKKILNRKKFMIYYGIGNYSTTNFFQLTQKAKGRIGSGRPRN